MKTILSADYHRNGVAGNGFHVAIFTDDDGSRKLGITFGSADEEAARQDWWPFTAILDLDKAAAGDIAFGSNSWRGDNYAAWLIRECGKLADERWQKTLAAIQQEKTP